MKRVLRPILFPAAPLLWLLVAGCDRDGVKVYQAATNDAATPLPPPTAAAPAAMPGAMPSDVLPPPDHSGLPSLKYSLPDGWKEKKLSAMRVASFEISDGAKTADVSVIPMGGMAGGDFANVNRWRGQVGLPPMTEEEVQKSAEPISVAGQPANLFDVAGGAQRIVVAVLHQNDTAWFFKMDGDADLVEKQKPAFVSFLKSFEFGGKPAPAAMDASQLPPSHPAISSTDAAPATPAGNKPAWTIPAGWQDGPLAQFLVAKFLIAGDNGTQASVNVSSLTGDGGGLAANVNRWRGQLGLPPSNEISSTPLAVGSGQASVVELSGKAARTGKAAQLVGVIVPQSGQTWFYKLMGDAEVVAQQKVALLKFVQSAKYPDVH